jgi:hypothetical protein
MHDIGVELRNAPAQSIHIGDIWEIHSGKSVHRESAQDLIWPRLGDFGAQNNNLVPEVP